MPPEKKAQVRDKAGAKEALPRFRRKDQLERPKDNDKHRKGDSGCGEQDEHDAMG
jgi:hypothetical protein